MDRTVSLKTESKLLICGLGRQVWVPFRGWCSAGLFWFGLFLTASLKCCSGYLGWENPLAESLWKRLVVYMLERLGACWLPVGYLGWHTRQVCGTRKTQAERGRYQGSASGTQGTDVWLQAVWNSHGWEIISRKYVVTNLGTLLGKKALVTKISQVGMPGEPKGLMGGIRYPSGNFPVRLRTPALRFSYFVVFQGTVGIPWFTPVPMDRTLLQALRWF